MRFWTTSLSPHTLEYGLNGACFVVKFWQYRRPNDQTMDIGDCVICIPQNSTTFTALLEVAKKPTILDEIGNGHFLKVTVRCLIDLTDSTNPVSPPILGGNSLRRMIANNHVKLNVLDSCSPENVQVVIKFLTNLGPESSIDFTRRAHGVLRKELEKIGSNESWNTDTESKEEQLRNEPVNEQSLANLLRELQDQVIREEQSIVSSKIVDLETTAALVEVSQYWESCFVKLISEATSIEKTNTCLSNLQRDNKIRDLCIRSVAVDMSYSAGDSFVGNTKGNSHDVDWIRKAILEERTPPEEFYERILSILREHKNECTFELLSEKLLEQLRDKLNDVDLEQVSFRRKLQKWQLTLLSVRQVLIHQKALSLDINRGIVKLLETQKCDEDFSAGEDHAKSVRDLLGDILPLDFD